MELEVTRGNCPCSVRRVGEIEATCDLPCPTGLFDDTRVPEPAADESVVALDPADLIALYGGSLEDVFLLVTSPEIRTRLRLENHCGAVIEEFSWHGPGSREPLIDALAQFRLRQTNVALLWITEDEFVHFADEQIGNAKVAAISFFSTGFSGPRLESYLRILRRSDHGGELRRESALLRILDQARRIEFRTPSHGTTAVFEHQRALHWFSLNGGLSFGQQTVLPTGELSALTDPSGRFSMVNPFQLNGELVLYGAPIVHRGGRAVSLDDTARTYQAMAGMRRHPAIVRVEDGLITGVRGDNPFGRALETLFESDARYRKVHEIGFGTNAACDVLLPDNFFPNERFPGVHFGLGLGGYTPFHIDLTCSQVDVIAETKSGPVDVFRALGLRVDPVA